MQCLLPVPIVVLRLVTEHTDGVKLGQSVHLEPFVAELAIGTCLHKEYVLETQVLAALFFGGDKTLLLGSVASGLVLQQLHKDYIAIPVIVAVQGACLVIHLRWLRVYKQRFNWQHFTW